MADSTSTRAANVRGEAPRARSTRQRAAQRMLGTLAGSVLASAFLWLQLPPAVLIAAAAGTMFAFGYWVKRDYAVAIFFITLFIVLLTTLASAYPAYRAAKLTPVSAMSHAG